jgi:hypothetical protein
MKKKSLQHLSCSSNYTPVKRESKKAEETRRKNRCKIICEAGVEPWPRSQCRIFAFFPQWAECRPSAREHRFAWARAQNPRTEQRAFHFCTIFPRLPLNIFLEKRIETNRYFFRSPTMLFAHPLSLIYKTAEHRTHDTDKSIWTAVIDI